MITALIWFCSVTNAGTGEVFSATNVDQVRARRGAMQRCYFFSGDGSIDCIADGCEKLTENPSPDYGEPLFKPR
jgi:hypothetical protein